MSSPTLTRASKANGKPPAAKAAPPPAPPDESLQLRELLRVMQAVRDGDFSVRLPGDWIGINGKQADTLNEIIFDNRRLAEELERVGEVVGRQGLTSERVSGATRRGAWGAMEKSVNTLIDDLLWPTERVTRAIAAVAKGDLTKTIGLEVDGRPLQANSCARPRSSTR